jgi:DNA-binding GntR family transcriptional regulator
MADRRHQGASEVDTAGREAGRPFVFTPIRKSGLTDTVYQRLRSEIVAARLLPGELLTLDELGTPLRGEPHARARGAATAGGRGLVLFREHRRCRSRRLAVTEIADTYALRILTEGFAVSESIRRAPPRSPARPRAIYRAHGARRLAGDSDAFYRRHLDFHRAIYAGAGSQELARVTEDLRTRTDRHRHVHASFLPGNLGATADRPRPHPGGRPGGRPACRRPAGGRAPVRTAVELLAQTGVDRSTLLDDARSAALDGLGGTAAAAG